jgi:hypothetical protein
MSNETKRQKMSTWDDACNGLIDASDENECKLIISKLENLLKKATQRKDMLEKESRESGMNYEGEDGVECDCGNVFEPEGDDAATCDFCDKEQCNDCVVYCPYCQRCEKHMFMCSECMKACTACDENFCKECITECCTCSEPYCNGDGKECALVTVGYRGEQSCVYCVEPR